MELRHLRYFLAVAEEASFSRAAHRLNISQPPLTRQIKNLEIEVGTDLFDRTTRHVSLTPAGRAFLTKARAAIFESHCAVEDARRSADGFSDTITLGFMSSVMLAELAPMVGDLHAMHPSIAVKFQQMRSDQQLEAVIDERIDAGFVDLGIDLLLGSARAKSVQATPVMHEKICVAVPKGHRLENRATVFFNDLAGEVFAILERHLFPAHYDTVIAACKLAGFTPRIAHHGDQIPTVIAYVGANMAVCFAPECARRSWSEYVSFIPLEEEIYIDVHMITKSGRMGSIDVLRQVLDRRWSRVCGLPAAAASRQP